MTCRIDRLVTDQGVAVLRVIGRIAGDEVEVLRGAIDRESRPLIVDLEEIGLVDWAAVTLLAVSEANGIELKNCPAYIREWVNQERTRL